MQPLRFFNWQFSGKRTTKSKYYSGKTTCFSRKHFGENIRARDHIVAPQTKLYLINDFFLFFLYFLHFSINLRDLYFLRFSLLMLPNHCCSAISNYQKRLKLCEVITNLECRCFHLLVKENAFKLIAREAEEVEKCCLIDCDTFSASF